MLAENDRPADEETEDVLEESEFEVVNDVDDTQTSTSTVDALANPDAL